MIEKASPVEMRKALEIVDQYRKAGIMFVPIPVLSKDEEATYGLIAVQQLQRIAEENI